MNLETDGCFVLRAASLLLSRHLNSLCVNLCVYILLVFPMTRFPFCDVTS